MGKRRIVVFSGAGMSAESGLSTFRDVGGLWDNYEISEVATPQAWEANPSLVLDFYNQRRRQIKTAVPNQAHIALARLEKEFDVTVITQNIDDLHERGGSKKVLHLHGEIFKAKTHEFDTDYLQIQDDIELGDRNSKGQQYRPHVVWFGEAVPEFDNAAQIMAKADIAIVIGTSLKVYPAAALLMYAPKTALVYIIDPAGISSMGETNYRIMQEAATKAVPRLVDTLLKHNVKFEAKPEEEPSMLMNLFVSWFPMLIRRE